MWCFGSCLTLGKSWTRLIKRRQPSKQTQAESESDGKLEQFLYAIVPLHPRHHGQYHELSKNTDDSTSHNKAPHHTIRLLRILGIRPDGLLECYVHTTELSNSQTTHYDALSYTWELTTQQEETGNRNDTERQCIIVCNDRRLLVMQNLFDCLMQLEANRYHDRDLWIDAICINQEDNVERCQQVSIMADIYRSAECVIIWLGHADKFTGPSWELMNGMSQLSDEELSTIKPQDIENKHNIKLLGHANSPMHWKALELLFEKRWFERAWVVQELVLARDTTVLCGDYTFDWESMAHVSDFMAKRALVNNASSPSYKKPAKLAAIKRGILDGPGNVLLHSLIRCRTYDAKDDHDKVYSLLGLAKRQGQDYPDCFNPNYQRDVAGLYTPVAKYIINCSDDLHILAHAEGDEFRRTPGLPTWVPDWSVKKDLGLRITGYARYHAAGTLPCFWKIQVGDTLTLRGFEFDTITRVGETKEEVNRSKTCTGWLDLLEELKQEYPERDYREAFWRTILIDTDPSGTVPIKRPWENSFYVWLNMCTHVPSEDEKHRAIEFETSFTHSLNLRLFRTSRGHLGCGSLSCREGDRVWIVQGSRVPLMLRPAQKAGLQTYELVGGTYLHGFMQGEALSGNSEFKEFTLI
ncbi:HET-domain-containing protein [Hypoxylon rubiginosum]|uniref:HET-domain-containing protein n=1 Tax=Hypoxylon rubiginosum TaxID=110542 RepID=A0ACB9Z524_9PEZI|nr:HET-domain-containing protein [Hypoxylon rubiginosum]